MSKANKPWTEIVAAKRAIRDARIQKYQPENRASDLDILVSEDYNAQELTDMLENGQVTAEELIRAYIIR